MAAIQHGHKEILLAPVRVGETVVGPIVLEEGVRTFDRRVHEARHLFRQDDSWTISGEILAQLREWKVRIVRYRSDEGTYTISLDDFLGGATVREFPSTGRQFCLPRAFWAFTPRPERRASRPAAPAIEQLSLLA